MPRKQLSGHGAHRDLVAERFEPAREPSSDLVAVAFIEVVGTEIGEGRAAGQDRVGDDDQAVADRHGRSLRSTTCCEPVVLGAEVGSRPAGGVCRVDERATQPGLPLRVRPEARLPADSWLPGHIPAHEARWRADGNRLISDPISASSVSAVRRPIPGIVTSRAIAGSSSASRRSIFALTSSMFRSSSPMWWVSRPG